MKKFLTSFVFVAGIFLVTISSAAAQDVYVKSYTNPDEDIYVVTESIDTNGVDYVNVTVKSVRNGKLYFVSHLNYVYVEYRNGIWQGYWEMSSVEGRRDGVKSVKIWKPYEDETLWFCLNYRR